MTIKLEQFRTAIYIIRGVSPQQALPPDAVPIAEAPLWLAGIPSRTHVTIPAFRYRNAIFVTVADPNAVPRAPLVFARAIDSVLGACYADHTLPLENNGVNAIGENHEKSFR